MDTPYRQSEKRPSLASGGKVRYQFKTLYRDGATPAIFEPPDFIARPAALIPRIRVNLSGLVCTNYPAYPTAIIQGISAKVGRNEIIAQENTQACINDEWNKL